MGEQVQGDQARVWLPNRADPDTLGVDFTLRRRKTVGVCEY